VSRCTDLLEYSNQRDEQKVLSGWPTIFRVYLGRLAISGEGHLDRIRKNSLFVRQAGPREALFNCSVGRELEFAFGWYHSNLRDRAGEVDREWKVETPVRFNDVILSSGGHSPLSRGCWGANAGNGPTNWSLSGNIADYPGESSLQSSNH